MRKNLFSLVAFPALALALVGCGNSTPAYKDASLPTEKRIDDLLSRMTLEEKAAQTDMLAAPVILNSENNFDEAKITHFIDSMSIGSIHDFYPKSAELANAVQKRAIERTRLGIPLIFIEEALHGYQGEGGTCFPVALGNASTWDTTLVNNIGKVIGAEARAHGVHFVLSPNLDLARELRWGRVEETYGEDVYLSSRMGVNIIKGMQGDTLSDDNTVAAEPKHYGIHGIPENGHNTSTVYIGEREARSTHLYIFEKAIKEAGARGVMAAYHEVDGVPVASNKWLLTDVLRNEWGFKGFVLSDLGAISKQVNDHKTAATPTEAIYEAINAGLDMQFYDYEYHEYQSAVVAAVKSGKLKEEALDRAVASILRVKFDLGLFENPYTDPSLIAERLGAKAHKDLTLQASRESLILLKNEDKTLPFSKDVKSIALIGNLANVSAIGGYSPAGAKGVTILEGLQNMFGDKVKINFETPGVTGSFTEITPDIMTPAVGKAGDKGLYVEYFNNMQLEGDPVYTGIDANLSPYWHNLSPAPGVNPEGFSVRWSGYLDIPATGWYEFSLVADDCGRMFIDDEQIIDLWDTSLSNKPDMARVKLTAGKHKFRLEYAELELYAGMKTKWRTSGTPSNIESDVTRAIAKSDVAIVVIGESVEEVGEGKDRSDLNITAIDKKVIEAATKTNKPLVVVHLSGRPLVLQDVEDNSKAIIQAWFNGERGGDAIAEVIFGDVNPSGHLTITFPKSQAQLPMYYSRAPSSKRTHIDNDGKPLYAFGHGLSYTSFEFSNMALSAKEIATTGSVEVSVDVTNTGDRKGKEVVQLYVRDKVSSVTTPIMALKGFSKVELEPGETKRVTMTLAPEHLSLINIDMERVTEPGEFDIMIGKSATEIVMTETLTVK